ncbi:hypothetical protein ACLIKD_01030 [Azonexus sp. IMCC34842]|uniref:hypothetical protein n=1 Tax=Azonexus sp. IMCC34842 TaxID=3420950 RepID=UPI003D0FD60B
MDSRLVGCGLDGVGREYVFRILAGQSWTSLGMAEFSPAGQTRAGRIRPGSARHQRAAGKGWRIAQRDNIGHAVIDIYFHLDVRIVLNELELCALANGSDGRVRVALSKGNDSLKSVSAETTPAYRLLIRSPMTMA